MSRPGSRIRGARIDGAAEAAAYHAAVRALADRGRFGVRLGLARTRALLKVLGDPQLALRGALVGGTNGKGSVLALASSALRAAGIRTGTTPKPHLVSYRERLEIDGRPIDPVTFTRLAGEVLAAADGVARRHGPPTEFELLTAMLFRWFAEERVEVALVEVGLGGRLDATHAWDGGVAAITNVALDHMAWLGDTIPAIAREKAAIIERGDLAVTGATGEALEVIRRRARRVGAPLTEVAPPRVLGWDRDGLSRPARSRSGRRESRFVAGTRPRTRRWPTRCSTRSRRRGSRASTPAARRRGLRERDLAGPPRARSRSAGTRSCWTAPTTRPARRPSRSPWTTFGRTSPAATEPTPPPLTLVHGSMADKDVGRDHPGARRRGRARGRAYHRDPGAGRAGPRGDRARPPLARGPPGCDDHRGRGRRGGAASERLPRRPGPVVVAGSLYLVGEARRRWLDDPRLRDPEDPPA